MGRGSDISQSDQRAVASGKGSLAINAAAYANVTVYQYVTYEGGGSTTREATDPSVCPYPGLETFHTSGAEYFAGREEDIALLEAKLEDHDICGVIAASGAGKSSLVHAGLVPALAKRESEAWDVFAFKPGQEPLYGLARSISGVLAQGDNLDAQLNEIHGNVENLRERPGRLSEYVEEIIRRRAGATLGKRHHVLIFVDQWEELYTTENDAERDILVRELTEVTQRGLAKVLLTMRIDFMEEMLLLSTDFFRQLKPGLHFLEPMDEIGLRAAIEVPARKVGLSVPEALTSRLIADLKEGRDHGSLPYLQFVLRQLWEKRDRNANGLTTNAYDRMKGLKGAIGAHADAVFRKLTKEEQQLAQRVLPRLANVSETGAITSRRLPFADFDEPARTLLRKLAEPERRLIVLSSATEEVAEAEIVAEVAHEALLDDWKTLSRWIADRKDFFRLRNKFEADAKTWIENNRSRDFLLRRGKPLTDACAFVATAEKAEVSDLLREFIDASKDSENRARIVRSALTILVTLIVAFLINYTVGQWNLLAQRNALQEAVSASELIESGFSNVGLLKATNAYKILKNTLYEEKLAQILRAGINRAAQETQFDLSANIYPFEWESQLFFQDYQNGELYRFDGIGSPSVVRRLDGYLIASMEVDSLGLIMVTELSGEIIVWSMNKDDRVEEICRKSVWEETQGDWQQEAKFLFVEISSSGILAIVSEINSETGWQGGRLIDPLTKCQHTDIEGFLGPGFLKVNADREIFKTMEWTCINETCAEFGAATIVERESRGDELVDSQVFPLGASVERVRDEVEKDGASLKVEADGKVLTITITGRESSMRSDTRRMGERVTFVLANSTSRVFALLSSDPQSGDVEGDKPNHRLVVIDLGVVSPWLESPSDHVLSQMFQRVCLNNRLSTDGVTSRATEKPAGLEDILAHGTSGAASGFSSYRFSADDADHFFSLPQDVSELSPCLQFTPYFDYFGLIHGGQATVFSETRFVDAVSPASFLTFVPFKDSLSGLVVSDGRIINLWDIWGLNAGEKGETIPLFSSPIGYVEAAYFDQVHRVLTTIESEGAGTQVARFYELAGENLSTPVYDLVRAKNLEMFIDSDGGVLFSSGVTLLGKFRYSVSDELLSIALKALDG